MSEEKLKPCPFCGGEAYINYEYIPGEEGGYWVQILCKNCHIKSGGAWARSYNIAARKEVKSWNKRIYEQD